MKRLEAKVMIAQLQEELREVYEDIAMNGTSEYLEDFRNVTAEQIELLQDFLDSTPEEEPKTYIIDVEPDDLPDPFNSGYTHYVGSSQEDEHKYEWRAWDEAFKMQSNKGDIARQVMYREDRLPF